VPVRIFPDRDQDLPHRPFDPGQVHHLLHRQAGQPAVDQTGGEVVHGVVFVARLGGGGDIVRQLGPCHPSEWSDVFTRDCSADRLPPSLVELPLSPDRPAPASPAFASASRSAGVNTGGALDGFRLPNPLYGASGFRLPTRAQIRSRSFWERVSFSISS